MDAEKAPRSKFVVQAIAFASLTALLVVAANLIAYGDSPGALYGKCLGTLIYNRVGPADVVVFGTSRVGAGVDGFVVSEGIESASGATLSVVPLRRVGWGLGDYAESIETVIEELGAPKLVVVDFSEQRPRYQSYGARYPFRVGYRELVETWNSSNEPLDGKMRDVLTNSVQKFDFAIDDTVTRDRVSIEIAEKTEKARSITEKARYCVPMKVPNARERRQNEKSLKTRKKEVVNEYGSWQEAPYQTWDFNAVDYERFDYMTKRLITAVESHDVEIVFFRSPSYLENQVAPEFVTEFEKRYGAQFLAPPPSVLSELYDGRMLNKGHVNDAGREVLSHWLGESIGEYLDER